MKRNLDRIDRRILHELQNNGRLSIVELASRVNLTKTPCAERVRRMEREGIITGYHADLDASELGAGFVMVVLVTLSQTSDNSLETFNEAIARIPEVRTCLMVAGNFDYLLLVRTSDVTTYRNVLAEKIGRLPGVQQTHSYVAMEMVKDEKTIPVPF